jgi:hypothetical protein
MSSDDPQTTLRQAQDTAFHIRQVFAGRDPRQGYASIAPPPLTRESITQEVRAVFAELDLRQLDITRRLSSAQRFRQVCELNRFVRRAALAAIRQQHPNISEHALQQQLLRRMGNLR